MNFQKIQESTTKKFRETEEAFSKIMYEFFDLAFWEKIPEYPNHLINVNLGKIRHKSSTRYLGLPDKKGYILISLSNKKRQKSFYLHRFIWEYVNGPITKGMQINHIDHNPKNNMIQNLELVTQSENLKKRRRFTPTIPTEIEEDLTDYEVLKNNSKYLINPKKGTLIHSKHKRILGSKKCGDYIIVATYENKYITSKLLHRLIWEQVNGPIPQGHEIDHIDSNKRNNCIDNLQCLAKEEHAKKTGQTTKVRNIAKRESSDSESDLDEFNMEGLIDYYEDEDTLIANGLKTHI